MTSVNEQPQTSSFLGALLSRRDWVYLLSLLAPLFIYNLTLKAFSVSSIPGLAPTFGLMRSDVFFNLGYALFWIGLFAVARRGRLRRVVVILFHAAAMLVVAVTTSAYQYFQQTGTTLDYGIVALWLPQFREVAPVLTRGATLWSWALLFVILIYVALGPSLVTRAVSQWRGWPGRYGAGGADISFSASLGLLLLAFGFGLLSLLIGLRSTDNPAGASVSFVRAPFVNLVLTGVKGAISSEEEALNADATSGQGVEHPAANAGLVETPQTEKRNVVLIQLESTRAQATTPYNEDLETTPFLDELAKSSLFAERAYTTVPHTSKASVSINCGIEPRLVQPTTESNPGGIPVPCLADLLKEQGYSTGLFQSSTQSFEDFAGLVENFGYKDYYPLESMDTEGFKPTNYFGYEDDIMLEPSKQWLTEQKESGQPFMAEYMTGTGHDDYQCLGLRYGDEDFSEDELLNRYLNCVRYQDFFLKNLIDQYKELGLYENTIFVIYGDHGEAFGEHRRYQHDDVMWEEGLKVPFMIHAPGLLDDGKRVKGLSNQTDILPTILDLLSYEVKDGEYPGYSLLQEPPEDRTLMFSCFHDKACMSSIEGDEKYIYNYGNQPDELFDLSEDPSEKNNLADEQAEEIETRREELLEWRSSVNAVY